MRSMPLLSIITVNLNNATGLRVTIDSVVNQTFSDYEYIIIDGGSTDGSVDIINEYAFKIHYWITEPDNGIYNAMNKGILSANGEYLQFLNSGDWLVDETTLEKVFIQKRTADILYGNIFEIKPDGSKTMPVSLTEDKLTLANFNSNSHPTIQHPASFIRKSLFNLGTYDESYKILGDIKFFIERIIMHDCSVENLPFAITYFNLYGMSANPANWARTIEERSRIFKELLPPRMLRDYELLFQIKDLPLLKYVPILEGTTGLYKLVIKIVDLITKLYLIVVKKRF